MTIVYQHDITDGSQLNWESWIYNAGTTEITDERPRSGNGSLEFNLPSGADAAGVEISFAPGDASHKLSDLTAASYDWYRDSSSTNPAIQQPALYMFVDGDGNLGTTSDQLYLFYEEAYNSGSVPTNSWVTSNTVNGNWWAIHPTSSGWPNAPGVVEVYNKTLANWMSQDVTFGAWTDPITASAVVVSIGINLGSGWNGVSQMFADNVRVVFGNASDVIANFEVLPPLPDCAPDAVNGLTPTVGTPQPDLIVGGGGSDLQRGLDGNDTLEGKGGADYLFGEEGKDSLYGGAGKDFLDGGAGADFVYGGAGDDTLKGDSCEDVGGKDRLYGGAGNDDVDGDGGNDTLWGEDGDDRLYGDEGDDLAYGGNGKDRVNGDDGDDRLYGGNDGDTVSGGDGDDTAYGDAGNDKLAGDDDDDSLFGGAGNDSMSGGDGDDVLNGDAGFDFYTGGSGDDLFVFSNAGTSAAPERDAITDFRFGQDQIDLRSLGLVDWTGSDSQITVVNEGTVPGLPLGSNVKTIYVDLNDDNSAANNLTKAELVIHVQAGIGGFVRDFLVSETNPFADILI